MGYANDRVIGEIIYNSSSPRLPLHFNMFSAQLCLILVVLKLNQQVASGEFNKSYTLAWTTILLYATHVITFVFRVACSSARCTLIN